ncbi:TonB-dependent receptor plug domain-containing protein [Chryseobacterium indoltheticum]|uniref:TonB-dependent receptor plug domain-containing protein n=1 Tax=Chryseobacterium indoltheticum TaxID=254 RepID=UPI003F490B51
MEMLKKLITLPLIFLANILWSQTENLSEKQEQYKDIKQVVVTATRTERKLKDVPVTTQVITSEAIEKSKMANFRDFMEQELAGVEFTNTGGHANINMMGFGREICSFSD